MAALLLLSGLSASARESGSKLKVAVLHFGPVGDFGWTYEGHLGAEAMAKALPYVELSERENAAGADAPRLMKEYAEAGYRVIFCHSYDFGEYIEEAAREHPQTIFMWGAGVEKKGPNTGIYFARMYEAKFLAGIVAGAMTRIDKIGYAAAMPIPEVVRGIDAFARGVASVNPRAKVFVEWVGTWFDPPKEKEVTRALIDKGCDVVTHQSDSYGPALAAEERGVYYISYNSDLRKFAPHVFLTGVVWNWAPLMSDIVKAVRDGSWATHSGQDWWYGLAENGIRLVPYSGLVPKKVKEMVEEKRQAIIKGELEVFPGMTDEELRKISHFESNVVGELFSEPKLYDDSNRTIAVRIGETFAVELEENPSTGYRWQETCDNSFVEVVSDSFVPPARVLVGAPGKRVFEFKALKTGDGAITLVLQRPWEEEMAETKVFTVSIRPSAEPKTVKLDTVLIKADTLVFAGYEVSKTHDALEGVWSAALSKNGKTEQMFSQGGRLKEWTAFGLFPFIGTGTPQLIVEQFSGGAHCCWTDWIINLVPGYQVLYASEDYPVGYGVTPVDIDGDGVFEFKQTIVTFDYFDRLPHALSPLPAAVFKYDRKAHRYLPANQDYADYLLAGIENDVQRVKNLNDTIDVKTYEDLHGEYLSAVLEVVLRYAYAGRENDGWRFFDKEYRLVDKKDMEAKIREKLETCLIHRSIDER